MHKDNLLNNLHPIFRKDKWLNALFNSVGSELDLSEEQIKQVSDQLFIDTATWFVTNYEIEAGIKPKAGQTLEDRRNAVEAKWKSDGSMTLSVLQGIADSWNNGDIEVSFDGQTITIKFVSSFGVPKDLNSFEQAIDDAKPAHLPMSFIFKYVLHSDVSKYTHWQLSIKTHAGIRDGDLPL